MFAAGHATSDAELEEMLESGNPAIFTQGVRFVICSLVSASKLVL